MLLAVPRMMPRAPGRAGGGRGTLARCAFTVRRFSAHARRFCSAERHDSPLPPVVSSRNRTANQFPLLSLLSSTSPTRAGGCAAIRYPPGPSRSGTNLGSCSSAAVFSSFFFLMYSVCNVKAICKKIMTIAITRDAMKRAIPAVSRKIGSNFC